MKKAISILLAIATIAFATSAMAAGTGSDATATASKSYNANTAMPKITSSLPCFRVGQTITITANSLDTTDGQLTVISYKHGEDLTDAYVQYINQYDLTTTSKAITYTVRDKAPGLYHLELQDGTGKATFYYTIGKVTSDLQKLNGSVDYYQKELFDGTYSVAFVSKMTYSIDGTYTDYSDLGINAGFKFNGTDDRYVTAAPAAGNFLEIDGLATYYYGVTVYNIDSSANADAITAEALSE